MKTNSLILGMLMLNLLVYAQAKPVYYYGKIIIPDSLKAGATSYGVFGKLSNDSLWTLKNYDLDNNLLFTGSYKDEAQKIPHGNFVFYGDLYYFNAANLTNYRLKNGLTRFIFSKGKFENGEKTGRWLDFYPDGRIKTIISYINGIKHGPFLTYDKRGKLETSGLYYIDERDGEWIYNKLKKKEVYIKGTLQPEIAKKSRN